VPSPHRRVGLIVDESVDSVLHLFREAAPSTLPEARIVRRAVVEGGLIEALVNLAASPGAQREQAARIVAQVRELVPSLRLNGQIKEELLEALSRAEARPPVAERRRRQLALIREAADPGDRQTAQDLADTFDAFERIPAR